MMKGPTIKYGGINTVLQNEISEFSCISCIFLIKCIKLLIVFSSIDAFRNVLTILDIFYPHFFQYEIPLCIFTCYSLNLGYVQLSLFIWIIIFEYSIVLMFLRLGQLIIIIIKIVRTDSLGTLVKVVRRYDFDLFFKLLYLRCEKQTF